MLRRATLSDLTSLLGMVEEYCALDAHEFDARFATRGLAPLLESDDHGVVWIIEPNDEPLGYTVVTWGWSIESGGRDALLDEVYVRTRSEGIGGAAIDEILDDLRRRGVRRVFLETEEANDGARRLYTRHGFEPEASIWMARQL